MGQSRSACSVDNVPVSRRQRGTVRPEEHADRRPPGSVPAALAYRSLVTAEPLLPRWGAVAVAVGAALVTDLAFPAVGWWWAAPVGVAALTVSLAGRRPGPAAVVGLLFGAAFSLAHLHWSGVYVGPVWLALAGAEAAYFALLGPLVAWTLRAPGGPAVRAVGVGGVWVAVEGLRARWPFGGFGWGRLAFSQADAPTLGLAAVGGAPLVSFAVAAAGALIAGAALALLPAWPPRRRQSPSSRPRGAAAAPAAPAAPGGALVLTAVGVLALGAAVPTPTAATATAGTVRVAAVQGNVPRPGLDFNAERRAVLDKHVRATQDLARRVDAGREPAPDLVVWPENASDIDPLRNADAGAVIDRAAAAVGVPLLVGTILRADGDGGVRNTTIVWDPVTGPGESYVKRHPVPFAEYVPYRSFFRRITTMVDLVRADMVAGHRVGLLTAAGVPVGVGICFEVVDDALIRDAVLAGAQVIAVQTNNATFGYTDESVQQLAMSRLRAVEHGRAVVHVSTVGVSALIAPDGTVLRQGGHFTTEVLTAELPRRAALTLATRAGAWPELVLAVGGLLVAAAGARSGRPGGRGPGGRGLWGTGRRGRGARQGARRPTPQEVA